MGGVCSFKALADIKCRYGDSADLKINYYVNSDNYNYYNDSYYNNVCAYFKDTELANAFKLLMSQRLMRETDRGAKREVQFGIVVLHGSEVIEFVDIDI